MSSNTNRKVPLEELEKEELIKRCKNYLTLAQKAKASKDDAQQRELALLEKITSLEETIVRLEKEKVDFNLKPEASSAYVPTTESLPEQKEHKCEVQVEEDDINLGSYELLKRQLKELEERYLQQKDGFVEELNKMNDLLKKRGETISKLEEKCQMLESELKSKIEFHLQTLNEKDQKIESLEQELNRFEMQSEVASTSTVSRAEEIHRMKDVEDSLEERYNRLKALAVKMKRKIAEQNALIADKDKQLSFLETKNSSKSNALNLPALQKDIDRLTDELDMKKSQVSVLGKDFESAVQELAITKQKSEELKIEVTNLRSSFANLEKQKNNLELSSQELKATNVATAKELETEKIMRTELSQNCDKLKNEIKGLKNTIDQLSRSHEATRQDTKKQSLLELELADYEKSVSELNIRLNGLQLENKRQENLLSEYNHEKNALLLKVKNLEERVESERKQIEESKTELSILRSECEELKKLTKELQAELKTANSKNESKECELENAKLMLSNTNADYQKYRNSASLKVEALQKQINIAEEKTVAERRTKEALEIQLAELRNEYESYRVRAAAVLKKAKTEVQSSASTSKDASNDAYTEQIEREMLQKVVEALKDKVSELESQHLIAQSEVTSLRTEKERAATAHSVALEAMQQRLHHCESISEKQKHEYQSQIARIQSDQQLLISLHRDQVEALKVQHAQEIFKFEARLEESAQETANLQKIIMRNNPPSASTTPSLKDLSLEEPNASDRINEVDNDVFSSVNRENLQMDARKPIPLDLLLSSSHIHDEMEIHTPEAESASIDHYKESLAVYEKQCQHLAALLADSEANEARLSQLADALKEEIRRAQRAEERQKHIENLEYLKNVVLKFITLPRGEERSRLVPVLTTLLRLSPSEVQEVSQTLNRSDGSTRPMAWGGVFNYFAPNQ